MTISITTTNDAQTLVNSILGSGITVSNLSYTGTAISSGVFIDGISSGIGIDEGIIITSGDATLVPGANTQSAAGISNDLPGDKDLNSLVPGASTFDATILEFDFESDTGDLFFNFVFASEEYNEYVGGGFDDVFGFFLDGQNIAIIPGTNTTVSIDKINNNQNTNLFNDNETGSFDNQYDGFTEVMAVEITDLEEGTHNIKLAIADTGDSVLDSAVFIQGNTFTSIPKNPTIIIPDTTTATVSIPEGQTNAIDIETTDDLDAESEGLTYSITGGADGELFAIDRNTGELSFIAAPDFEKPGDADGDNNYQVQVTVYDSGELTDFVDLNINVSTNLAPSIISTDSVSILENTTLVIDLMSLDDNDAEGMGLTYSITGGADGELFAINPTTGIVDFIAAPDFDEPLDSNVDNDYELEVTIADSGTPGLTDVQNITVTVTKDNESPEAVDNSYETLGGNVVTGNLISEDTGAGIDSDSDEDPLSVISNSEPSNGSVIVTTDGSFSYTPNPGFIGSDSFTYTITDGNGGNDTATVNVTVNPINDLPDAVDNNYSTNGAITVSGNLISDNTGEGLDNDLDFDPLFITSNSNPSNGSVIVNPDGNFTYTLNPGFTGIDSFTYTISDGNNASDTATVIINVNNQPPTITTPATVTVGETKTTVTENQTTVLDINITDDLDVEGTGLTYRITGGADQILFNLHSSTGVLSFASTPDFENPADTNRDNNYQVQVTVTDSTGLSTLQDLTISIADDPTDNPVIQNLLTESLNTVGGTLGNDALTGTTNSDSLEGLAGNDVLDGRAGNDLLNGGLGTDTAVYQSDPAAVNADLNRGITSGGFGGNDTFISIENIIGSEFNDTILGNAQNNSLTGKGGNDTINAGGGNDFLVGSAGADTLTGGSGADSFIYLSPSDGIGDLITDFEVDLDQILIVGALFPEGLFGGVLPEFQFFFGSEAEDEDHRFGYDPEKSQILFDRDGDGSANLQVLATLVGSPDFGHNDIKVI